MTTIYKYELSLVEKQTIKFPKFSQILDAQIQDRKLCIWAIINTTMPIEDKEIYIVGTGAPIEFDLGYAEFIATIQIPPFVWHIFQQKK